MKKILVFLVFLLAYSQCFFAQQTSKAKVHWLTIEQVTEMQKIEKKKVIIDVYTSWCGWCKYMEQSTFNHPEIVYSLNTNFYAVKFDAESKADVKFNGKVYKYVIRGNNGINEFALEMMNGIIAPPALVVLDENMNVIQPMEGFQSPEKFEAVLNYFSNNLHKKIPWSKYEQQVLKANNTKNTKNK